MHQSDNSRLKHWTYKHRWQIIDSVLSKCLKCHHRSSNFAFEKLAVCLCFRLYDTLLFKMCPTKAHLLCNPAIKSSATPDEAFNAAAQSRLNVLGVREHDGLMGPDGEESGVGAWAEWSSRWIRRFCGHPVLHHLRLVLCSFFCDGHFGVHIEVLHNFNMSTTARQTTGIDTSSYFTHVSSLVSFISQSTCTAFTSWTSSRSTY